MDEAGIKVLIVDDSLVVRNILINYLKAYGVFTYKEANNGAIGLQKLREEKYDLVFLDWNMPVMSGLEMLKSIRKDEKLKNIFVIMITSETKKENILAAVQAGVNEYIIKPFSANTLKEKIKRVFNTLLFGEYLVRNKVISTQQLNEALETQSMGQKMFGQIAIELKLLTQEQVDDIHKSKGVQRFGKAAMRMKMLSMDDLVKIMDIQDENRLKLGEVLVKQGVISEKTTKEHLDRFLLIKRMR